MRGVANSVSPSTGFRFVCYCKDCQAFARFLDRTDVLDPAGGTNIFHMPPARMKLTAGAAYGFSKHQTKKYTATASLVFNNNQPSQQVAGLPVVSNSTQAQQNTNLKLVQLGDIEEAALRHHALERQRPMGREERAAKIGVSGLDP